VATAQQIRIETNSDFEMFVRWENSMGVPYELLDVRMQVRANDTGQVVVEATLGNGLITVDDEGWIVVLVPSQTLRTITHFGSVVFDLVAQRATDGRVARLVEGSGTISKGVTQWPTE
jgi:hypothetical protein